MPLNVQVKSHMWIELETVLDEVVLPLPESVLPPGYYPRSCR